MDGTKDAAGAGGGCFVGARRGRGKEVTKTRSEVPAMLGPVMSETGAGTVWAVRWVGGCAGDGEGVADGGMWDDVVVVVVVVEGRNVGRC